MLSVMVVPYYFHKRGLSPITCPLLLMDRPENMRELYKLGALAAKRQVYDHHFPARLDLEQQSSGTHPTRIF